MSDLLPCPFCGEAPSIMSVGMAGQPRWQHPVNDTCPIAGHYLGGWDFPVQWNQRALPAVQPGHVNETPKSEHDAVNMLTLTAVQPDALHRSFPEAGDGRPFPPMIDELMTAGLNAEDARFVAVQLKQNGYSLTKESKSLFGLAGEP